MSKLGNDEIEQNVSLLVSSYLAQTKTKVTEKDAALIKAGTDLMINLLQNINDIAYAADRTYYDRMNHGR